MMTNWRNTKAGRKSIRELKDYNLVGNMPINETERSKSNSSRCHMCHKRIGKNTLRGVNVKYDNEKKINMRFVYCSGCSKKLISNKITVLRNLRKLFTDRERTRKKSYKKQEDLQLKDEILNKLKENKDE